MSLDQAAGVLFALLAVAIGGPLLYEAWALLTKHTPITWFARLGIADHPRFAFVVALGIGVVFGHLFWK